MVAWPPLRLCFALATLLIAGPLWTAACAPAPAAPTPTAAPPAALVTLIADGKHLPPTLMKLAYRCLGPDRLCIVSDATSGAGLPEGSRFFMAGAEYEVADGVGMTLDRASFAGSTTLLDQMLAVVVEAAAVPIVEAVRMATLTPARVAGVSEHKGSLEAGKDADITIFDAGLRPWRTLIGGQWVEWTVEE